MRSTVLATLVLGLLVSGCGANMEQKAATGGGVGMIGGAVVGGPVGLLAGGTAGAAVGASMEKLERQDRKAGDGSVPGRSGTP